MENQRPLDRDKRIALWVIVGAVVAALAAFTCYSIARVPKALFDAATKSEEKTITVGEIVTRVRALNRLETASVEVMHVSTTTQSYGIVPKAIAGDELTFLAVGQVIAGVDLSRMTDNDVRVEGKRITVFLPPPEVLVTRLDNRRSRVIRRDTGVLKGSDVNLEGRVRERAEGEIRSKAVREGVLNLAQKNAAARVAELLHRSGYDDVIVTQKSGSDLRELEPQR